MDILEVTDYLPLGWWSRTNKPLWLAIYMISYISIPRDIII